MDKKNDNPDKRPYPYKKEIVDIVFSNNWKQQVLSKPQHRHAALTSMMIGLQTTASLIMTMFAVSQVCKICEYIDELARTSKMECKYLSKICANRFQFNHLLVAQGGGYTAPAIAASTYTLATINNSFEGSLMGMIGFLDSPVSIFVISGLSISNDFAFSL